MSNEVYYRLDFVAKEMDLSIELVLFVMGSVKFIYERHSEESTDGIDVGLNFIDTFESTLVPQLVRLPGANASVRLLP